MTTDQLKKKIERIETNIAKVEHDIEAMTGKLDALFNLLTTFVAEHAPVEVHGGEEELHVPLPNARIVIR
jgi:chaperonin cofactor prefoldin